MNIPTSLIVVLLVAAWIVVLVPMVAKRRERVPESKTDGTRVLGRAAAGLRRRPKGLRRTADGQEQRVDHPQDERASVASGEPADAAEEWAAAHSQSRAGTAVIEADAELVVEDADVPGKEEASTGVAADGGDVEALPDAAGQEALFDDDAPSDREGEADEPARAAMHDEYDEQEWAATQPRAGWDAREDGDESRVRDEELRPVPRRPGRGGFDPEAAEAIRAYKYRRRRRITLLLLVATLGFGIAAPVSGIRALWAGAAVSFLLLVAYLAYLRRQVKIENAIRQRRMERLQRARQIRPEYGPARRGHLASRGREVVDLDDDDPSFDDLDEYEPVQYRRAV